MPEKIFLSVFFFLSLLLTTSLCSCQRYESHKSQWPVQQGEDPVGLLSITTDLNIIINTKRAKDKLVYKALKNRAVDKYGNKIEIRNMIYREKFKFFNLLVVEAAGVVVTTNKSNSR